MADDAEIVTRFAPSPTGGLHLGHAFSALLCFEAAQDAKGRFLLRVEDIDRGRCRAEHERAMLDDLAWLGLEWEQPVRRQSEHFSDYREALESLAAMGLLYPCFCTRAEIRREIEHSPNAPHGPDGYLYPGTCRALTIREREARLAADEPHALRLDATRAAAITGQLTWRDDDAGEVAAEPELLGDAVLARKDVPTSYHLAVTVDDHLQGITLVIRGRDLFHATHLHRLLQELLGYPSPRYRHHAVLGNDAGQRLSKRDQATTLKALRASGATPDDIKRLIRERLGDQSPGGRASS